MRASDKAVLAVCFVDLIARPHLNPLPLLGERVGVRAGSLDTNIPFFGLAGRAGIKTNFSNIPPFPKILSGPTSHARASFAKMKLGGRSSCGAGCATGDSVVVNFVGSILWVMIIWIFFVTRPS